MNYLKQNGLKEDIPYDDYDVSLTREMMIQFKKGLDGSVCEE